MTIGHKAEQWMASLLREAGYTVLFSNRTGDRIGIDFWIQLDRNWIAIQFTVNRKRFFSWKAQEAIQSRIVPVLMDDGELDGAVHGDSGLQGKVLEEFWEEVNNLLKVFPQCRRVQSPNLIHTRVIS